MENKTFIQWLEWIRKENLKQIAVEKIYADIQKELTTLGGRPHKYKKHGK